MSHLIVHPQTIALRKHVHALHTTLGNLVRKRIHLTFEELPAIRYRYATLFGSLEREIEQRTLEMSERKRLVELFALKLDRGQTLDSKTIELTMKVVYKEFENIRSRVMRETAKAAKKADGKGLLGSDITVNQEPVTAQRRKELRECYRTLAKRLHPDTRKVDNPLTETWWELVQRSYQRHDIHSLRTLLNIVETTGTMATANVTNSAEPTPIILEQEKQNLEQIIATEQERLRTLQKEEPYSIRQKLDDETWIAQQKQELQKEIETVKVETAKCDEFLKPILAGTTENITPETVQTIWSNFIEDAYLSGRY